MDALTAAITDGCSFDSTLPPDGDSYEGKAAIAELGQVRGVDLFRVRDDKVAEKLFYVTG